MLCRDGQNGARSDNEMTQRTIWMLALIAMCLSGQNVVGGQTQDKDQVKETPRKESLEKEGQKQAQQQQIERIMVVLRMTGANAKDWKNPIAASRVQATPGTPRVMLKTRNKNDRVLGTSP